MPPRKKIISTVGKNLPAVLSRSLVKDWYAAVSEFVCNSYDANAEEVHITLNEDLGTLVIKDDGEGMDVKGLDNFFRLADSDKIENPISPPPKRRRRIGKYGIAKVLLQYLGDSFKVESIKKGYLYCVDEGIGPGRIKGQKHEVPKDAENGTTITIRSLRFSTGKGRGEFDIRRLQARLEWEVPNNPDFNVYVNNQLVKKRGVVEYARVYRVQEKVGRNILEGRIYWRQKGAKDLDGIHIYVNNRAVGDPSMFDLSKRGYIFEGRTLGEVHADFLEDLVTLDRSDFQEDPKLDKVKSAVIRVLSGIKEDASEGRGRISIHSNRKYYEIAQEILGLAEEELNSKLKSQEKYVLALSSGEESGPIARLDSESRTIQINGRNKMFAFLGHGQKRFVKRESEDYLKRAFLIAAAHALATNGAKDCEFDRLVEKHAGVLFKDYTSLGQLISRFLTGRPITPLRDIYLNKYRLYSSDELSDLTGRPSNTIRMLHNSGALRGTEEHLFDKPSVIEGLKPIEGMMSCTEAVDSRYREDHLDLRDTGLRVRYDFPKPFPVDVTLSSAKLKRELDKLGVVDVGKIFSFHFVPVENADIFRAYMIREGLYNGD